MYHFGLVLSGGGARGMAHLGVLQALNEMGVKPDIISGCSAGAIVGAFYANGYSPSEIVDFILKSDLAKKFNASINGLGIFNMKVVSALYDKYFMHNSFEELKIPLIVAATDIVLNQTVYFDSGELIPPIMASSSIPILFNPVNYRHHVLLDGGIINNLPVDPLVPICQAIIGVHVNPPGNFKEVNSKMAVIEKTFSLAIYANVKDNAKKCHICIEPDGLTKYSIFDISHSMEMFELGYQHTRERTGEILRLLNNL